MFSFSQQEAQENPSESAQSRDHESQSIGDPTVSNSSSTAYTVDSLPPAAIDLATRLFNFARQGQTASLEQYLSAGIPPNLTNGSGDTLLMLAAYHGHAETVAMLLRLRADPNALNDRGQSPLAGAVFKGHIEVVRVLLAQANTDVYAGHPNAVDSARMFRREDFLSLMGVGNVPNGV